MVMGTVFDIQRFCLHDGDGIRTTVFLKGCPLRCIWCHNPESAKISPDLMLYSSKCTSCGRCVIACPASARSIDISNMRLVFDRSKCILCGACVKTCPSEANRICGYEISAEDAFKTVLRDEKFYRSSGGGMTVSGGEPSSQSNFTLKLLELAKENGISSAIETCGFGDRDFYKEALDLGCVFLYDIKAADSALHKKLTGVPNEKIISNLRMLADLGADIRIRLPLVPTMNDSDEDLARLAELLESLKGKIRYAEIMPYHTLGITKESALGIESRQIGIPDGRQYAEMWKRKLEDGFSGEVRIST